MIELLPETGGNLIAVKMSGTITEEDFDRYFAEANAIFNRERVEHLVFDWEHLKGWAPGARSVGTWIGMHHRALVGRVAIIANEKWADEALRITDIFKAADARLPVDDDGYATIKGFEVMRMFKKGQFTWWIDAIGGGTEART